MKYSLELDVDVPRAKMVELFDNPDNMPKWQPDLVSFEHKSGTPGEVGAQSLLRYKMGKREIEMVETVIERNLPDTFYGTYEADKVWNKVENRFIELGPNKTRWAFESEFKCRGAMKLMAWLMPGMFKRESKKHMERFKVFAESEHAET